MVELSEDEVVQCDDCVDEQGSVVVVEVVEVQLVYLIEQQCLWQCKQGLWVMYEFYYQYEVEVVEQYFFGQWEQYGEYCCIECGQCGVGCVQYCQVQLVGQVGQQYL